MASGNYNNSAFLQNKPFMPQNNPGMITQQNGNMPMMQTQQAGLVPTQHPGAITQQIGQGVNMPIMRTQQLGQQPQMMTNGMSINRLNQQKSPYMNQFNQQFKQSMPFLNAQQGFRGK